MLILAIDTATKIGSVALYDTEIGVIGEINILVKTNHSAVIMEIMDNLFKITKRSFEEVGRVAVGIGPGSFTGIRIGVSIAKALCFGNEKEIVGVNELEVIAYGTDKREGLIVPLIDAKKERVYYSIFQYKDNTLEQKCEYRDIELKCLLEQLKEKEVYFTGDATLVYKELIESMMGEKTFISKKANSIPRSAILAELASRKEKEDLFLLEPFYLSKPQAEKELELKKIKENI